ncbi:MAG: lysophospholipid acyltransferase family protein [Gallionellaceae bacterium]|nr:lysophospholipid acyltransferase family protein [Gallionellaceae bacterium]
MSPAWRLLAALPLPVLHALAWLAGMLVFPWSRRARDVTDNLRQAGLDRPEVVRRARVGIARMLFESLAVWLRPFPEAMALVREVRGWEHVEAARAAGRGIVVLEPHLGNWELGGLYLGQFIPVTFLYRPARQPGLAALMRRGRERGGVRLATPDMRGVRAMLQALKRGEGVGVLPDQVASKGDGVWAPFFGRPAYTPTLAFRLLQSTGAVPLILFCERLPWGRGFRLHVVPAPAFAADPATAARQLNACLEDLIRCHPDQYLWTYRRYKRPSGAPPPGEAS